LCLIVVPLPPGENTFAVKINTNNKIMGVIHVLQITIEKCMLPVLTVLQEKHNETRVRLRFRPSCNEAMCDVSFYRLCRCSIDPSACIMHCK
jgi:hypothetical protein